MPFGIILNTFSQMLRNSKNATLSSEILDLGGVGPPFLHFFAYFLNVLFMLLSRRTFCSIFADLGLQRGSVLGSILTVFANFA